MMWFRADLRIRDNRALHHACREATDGVVGVFLIAPAQWRKHDWAGCKVEFLLRNLWELARVLKDRNIPLLVATAERFSDAPATLLKLARSSGCRRLHFNKEYEVNEARRDELVRAAFEAVGHGVRAHDDQVVLAPGTVRTGEGRYFTVFTPFRKKWIERLQRGDDGAVLPLPRGQKVIAVRGTEIPLAAPGFTSSVPSRLWPAGEAAALRRLERFVDRKLPGYNDDRDAPAHEGTSRLSAYLALGVLSPRQCLKAAVERNRGKLDGGNAGAAQWISELVWREFYKHIVAGYPRVCLGRAFKPATDRIRWRYDETDFAAWCAGRTGVPIIDAGMRQLRAEGWMHNRLRMVTAMYLAKDLFIDWRWGERHFMRHLVDGDFAANNGGWQWSASTGTDAAPYFRVFNPVNQSRTHDPDGAFIRKYVPELAGVDAEEIHDPPSPVRKRVGYPEPLVDHAGVLERVKREFERVKR